MPFNQILLRRLIKDQYLLLLLLDGDLETFNLLLALLHVDLVLVLFACTLERFFDVLDLLGHQKCFGLSLPDLHGIKGVLLVELDQSLLELDDLLVGDLNLLLNVLLLAIIHFS